MRSLHALTALLLAACAGPPYAASEAQTIPEPAPEDVAAVLFLVGDAGDAVVDGSPLVHRLRRDVERWSVDLPPDAAVAVLFLGDNVYPAGVRDPGTDDFVEDTTRLSAQAWAVEGPEARGRRARAVFVPGNHDWGNMEGEAGLERLRNEARVIQGWAARGRPVSLLPEPGSGGPAALDLGPALVAIVDTEWWLQTADEEARTEAVDRLEDLLFSSRGRPVLVAGHHPLASVGPHGQRGILDPSWVLSKLHALPEDLGSDAYETMRSDFSRAFAQSDRPLAFVGGHDHSLQVLRTAGPGQPGWSLVSGAGSQVTSVSKRDDVAWAGAQPGYMRLVFLTEGSVELFVEAAPKSTLDCSDARDADACIQQGLAAYRTVYSARLR
jgi:hypothetical protein